MISLPLPDEISVKLNLSRTICAKVAGIIFIPRIEPTLSQIPEEVSQVSLPILKRLSRNFVVQL